MFEENENPVIEEITENVEETTEETEEKVTEEVEQEETTSTDPKLQEETFTKEQVDEMIAKKLARKEAKIRREYDKKYGRLENVLKVGTGEEDLEKLTDSFADFYTNKGIKIPETSPSLSDKQMEILAEAEANEIIASGYDEIKEELNRLANMGIDNMTPQEKKLFPILSKELRSQDDKRSLASIGITNIDDDFKTFAEKLNPDLSMKEKYEMYMAYKPQKNVETIGSMKNGQASKVKDFYTQEEIERLTEDDLDDPKIWEAVRKSMTGRA